MSTDGLRYVTCMHFFPKDYKQGQLFTQVKQYFFQDGYSKGQVDRVAV